VGEQRFTFAFAEPPEKAALGQDGATACDGFG
jgi:hypothetical protein